jgi:hypothetical protein
MVFICAVGAAIANALTSIFQRMGVEDAPTESTLTLGLLIHACGAPSGSAGSP